MPPFVSPLLSLLLSMSVQAQPNVSGSWAMTVVDFGLPNTMRLVLKQDGDKLTGTLGSQTLEGTLGGVDLTLKAGSREVRGKLVAGRLAGQVRRAAARWNGRRSAFRSGQRRCGRTPSSPRSSSCISHRVSSRSFASLPAIP